MKDRNLFGGRGIDAVRRCSNIWSASAVKCDESHPRPAPAHETKSSGWHQGMRVLYTRQMHKDISDGSHPMAPSARERQQTPWRPVNPGTPRHSQSWQNQRQNINSRRLFSGPLRGPSLYGSPSSLISMYTLSPPRSTPSATVGCPDSTSPPPPALFFSDSATPRSSDPRSRFPLPLPTVGAGVF